MPVYTALDAAATARERRLGWVESSRSSTVRAGDLVAGVGLPVFVFHDGVRRQHHVRLDQVLGKAARPLRGGHQPST